MKSAVSILVALGLLLATTSTVLSETESLASGSGTSIVYGPVHSYLPIDGDWGTGQAAVAAWTYPRWPTLTDAIWISSSYYTPVVPNQDSWFKYTTTKSLCSGASNVFVSVTATADNSEEVYFNGKFIGGDGAIKGSYIDNLEWSTFKTYSSTLGSTDKVVIDFIVRNYASPAASPTGNPTGLLYKMNISYACPIEVTIDIKPGSFPSCFNLDGNGVIPVAINGSSTFDVTKIDQGSVTLEGLPVSEKHGSAYEDWNHDGYTDLVLNFVDIVGTFNTDTTTATLRGYLKDGTPFSGTGDICITRDNSNVSWKNIYLPLIQQ